MAQTIVETDIRRGSIGCPGVVLYAGGGGARHHLDPRWSRSYVGGVGRGRAQASPVLQFSNVEVGFAAAPILPARCGALFLGG